MTRTIRYVDFFVHVESLNFINESFLSRSVSLGRLKLDDLDKDSPQTKNTQIKKTLITTYFILQNDSFTLTLHLIPLLIY